MHAATMTVTDVETVEVTEEITLTKVNLLDLMAIGADESAQMFGSFHEDGARCALGAMALGARKLGLM